MPLTVEECRRCIESFSRIVSHGDRMREDAYEKDFKGVELLSTSVTTEAYTLHAKQCIPEELAREVDRVAAHINAAAGEQNLKKVSDHLTEFANLERRILDEVAKKVCK